MASDGDFDEGDLWEEDKASPHRRPAHELHGDSSGSEDDGAFPGARPHRAEPSPGTADPSSGSNRSSQLQTIFDGVELSSPKAEPVAMGRRVTRTLPPPPAPRPMAFSLPAAPVRMGTSVPIAIHRPVGGRWASGNSSDDEDGGGGGGGNDGGNMRMQLQAGTFIPPHQMSQRDDFMSMIADGQIKRDRLKTRNAVLRSTGFLEPGTAQAATVGLQERQRIATTAAAGGLTQALHPAAQ